MKVNTFNKPFFLIVALILLVKSGIVFAQWGGCQCCYCDSIVNGVCIVNGQPSPCIGCIGSCSGGRCVGTPGQGGCGAVIVWCRDSDCQGQPSPPPSCHPCGCCIPTSCGGGRVGFLEETPFVLVNVKQLSNNPLVNRVIKGMSMNFPANITLSNERTVKEDITVVKTPNPLLASLQFFGNFFKNFLNWVNNLISGIKGERADLFFGRK
jgi:hypothetical protein